MTQAATTESEQDILEILAKHGDDQGGLIAILEEIQTRYGYLPEDALRTVADETGRSLVDIYGVATFYHSFSLKPQSQLKLIGRQRLKVYRPVETGVTV